MIRVFPETFTPVGVIYQLRVNAMKAMSYPEIFGTDYLRDYIRSCRANHPASAAKVMFIRERIANSYDDSTPFNFCWYLRLAFVNRCSADDYREQSKEWLYAAFKENSGLIFVEPPDPEGTWPPQWGYRFFVYEDWKTPVLALDAAFPNPRWISYEDWHKLQSY